MKCREQRNEVIGESGQGYINISNSFVLSGITGGDLLVEQNESTVEGESGQLYTTIKGKISTDGTTIVPDRLIIDAR